MTRQHSSQLISAKWGCNRCNAGGNADNAQGLAVQHHDSKGHPTWVEITRRTDYGATASPTQQSGTQGSML